MSVIVFLLKHCMLKSGYGFVPVIQLLKTQVEVLELRGLVKNGVSPPDPKPTASRCALTWTEGMGQSQSLWGFGKSSLSLPSLPATGS